MACSRCKKAKRKCVPVQGRDICERCRRLGYDCDLNFKNPSHPSPTTDRTPIRSNDDSSHTSVQDPPALTFSKTSSSPNSATHTPSSKRLRSTDAALNRAPLDNPDQGQDCGSQRPCHRRGPAAFHYNPCESPAQSRSQPCWTPPRTPRQQVSTIASPILSGRWEPPKRKYNQVSSNTPKPEATTASTPPLAASAGCVSHPADFGSASTQQKHGYRRSNKSDSTTASTPAFCVYRSRGTNSSKRTRAGYVAHLQDRAVLPKKARHFRSHRDRSKATKQDDLLITCALPHHLSHLVWSDHKLAEHHLVFDGGLSESTIMPFPHQDEKKWASLRISSGGLHIADTRNRRRGLISNHTREDVPTFIRLPRAQAISMTKMQDPIRRQVFIHSLDAASSVQPQTLRRGKKKTVFSQDKYVCMGNSVLKSKPGVNQHTPHAKKMETYQWDAIVDQLSLMEKACASIVPTGELQKMNHCRSSIGHLTMSTVTGDQSLKNTTSVGFGHNVYLECHRDDDFTYSITTVITDDPEELNDEILAYFCFPRLGIAVPLRAGDILLFNATEPHAMSSRTSLEKNVYAVSTYTKTAVIGLNDNSISLTRSQRMLEELFRTTFQG